MFVKSPVPKLLPVLGPTEAPPTATATAPALAATDPTTVGWGPEPQRHARPLPVSPEERLLYVAVC